MLRHEPIVPHASLGATAPATTSTASKVGKVAAFGLAGLGLYMLAKSHPLAGIGLMGAGLAAGGLVEAAGNE